MQIINEYINYKRKGSPLYLALGNFDGVHRGHQQLLIELVKKAHVYDGLAGVFVFDPHPLHILNPNHTHKILTSIEEKAKLFEKLGVDLLIINSFTPELSRCSPREFVKEILVDSLSIKEAFVGFNYSFGHKGQGTPKILEELGKEHNFDVTIISPIKWKGKIVSSTMIRKALAIGDMETSRDLLNHKF